MPLLGIYMHIGTMACTALNIDRFLWFDASIKKISYVLATIALGGDVPDYSFNPLRTRIVIVYCGVSEIKGNLFGTLSASHSSSLDALRTGLPYCSIHGRVDACEQDNELDSNR